MRGGSKQHQIVAAARSLFLSHGFGGASMDAIAQEAAISKATLYAYFASKEDLFAHVITTQRARQVHGLDGVDTGEAIAPMLERLAVELAELILSADTVAIYRIIMSESVKFPDLGARFYAAGPDEVINRLAACLQAAMARGDLLQAPPREAAAQFIGLILGDLQVRALLSVGKAPGAKVRAATARRGATVFLNAYNPKKAVLF